MSTGRQENTASAPLLRVRDLKTYFRTKAGPARAVDGVSFELAGGETLALVGESGSGKSVTALSIMQLVPEAVGYQAGGSIEYLGQDLTRLSETDKRRLRGGQLAMIFQEPMTALNPVLSAGFQLVESLRRHRQQTPGEARQRAIELLGQVNIPDPVKRFEEYPHQLSGGMKQRVMIAMAMAGDPRLLIADEPTTALDVTIQAQILELMKSLQERNGMAILLITHDLAVVAQTADRVAIMYAGRIVEHAPRERLFANPAHPYTIRLLQSLPSGQQRRHALQTIEGRVPAPTQFPPGCRFADRCHLVEDRCRRDDPALVTVETDHTAACLLYDTQGREGRPPPAAVSVRPQPSPAQPASDQTLVRLSGLKVHFPIRRGVLKRTVGSVKAVDGVDLDIRRSHTLALVGESGCGKTTLGKAVLQLIRPSAGQVWFDGADLTALGRQALHAYRRRLQVVFQDPYASLNQRMMVGEIVTEGMAAHGIGNTRAEREERAKHLLTQVGLDPDMIHRYPHEFSGGQRQRIGIARCLAVEPDFLVCDEATSALDVSVQAQILNLLRDLQTQLGLTYLFITHNLGLVEYFADEVAVMYLGRIVERGTTEQVFRNPRHPYTQVLLSAVPKLDPASGLEKIRLSGDVPSPINPPHGCHFHPRCPSARPECQTVEPAHTRLGQNHSVWCHLYQE